MSMYTAAWCNHLVDVAHRLGCQSFRLFLCFDAVYSAAIQQVFVELLQVQRSEFCQRDTADLWLDVVFEEALAGLERRRAQLNFGVILHPHFQPCSHGVGLGPSVVDTDVFLDGFFQFSFTSACVLPRTFLMMALPVSGS